jgi:hypothetical protein
MGNNTCRFEVLTVVIMKSYIFWDITLYSLLKVNRHLGEHVTSIIKIEEQTRIKAHYLHGLFFDAADGAYSSSETSFNFQ